MENKVKSISICALERVLFEDDRSVLVLDVDGVLVGQIRTYFNGERGDDSYIVDRNANRVINEARRKFDEVVLWSAFPNYINYFNGKIFHSVPYHVLGAEIRKVSGKPYKNLKRISKNVKNLVAIEDDRMFSPRDRVIHVPSNKFNLIYALYLALDKF
ncbi:hypothetical protein HY450_00815 [Candidatus Pacearchaeota archaeon]|nr:hypothetical protein [Candidatus Pacearchaeota archaeon]